MIIIIIIVNSNNSLFKFQVVFAFRLLAIWVVLLFAFSVNDPPYSHQRHSRRLRLFLFTCYLQWLQVMRSCHHFVGFSYRFLPGNGPRNSCCNHGHWSTLNNINNAFLNQFISSSMIIKKITRAQIRVDRTYELLKLALVTIRCNKYPIKYLSYFRFNCSRIGSLLAK